MRRKSIILPGSLLILALTLPLPLLAQEAPPPRRMPRIAVNQQLLTSHSDAPARQVSGQSTIIDGERLRIGDTDLRLFGIVPPQLSANFGPQARTALDVLTASQIIQCQIRDRDHDGRLLATCHNAGNADLALELLKRGLAVTARGSLANTELATSYIAAEQAAQAQKLGLWTAAPPAPAIVPAQAAASPTPAETPKVELVNPEPITVVSITEPRKDKNANAEKPGDALQRPTALAPTPLPALLATDPILPGDAKSSAETHAGFIERYQLLLTGLVMLLTTLSILIVLSVRQRADRRDEIKAIAAALRGELTTARAVYLSRLKTLTTAAEDKAGAWPRLRNTLYQAYVGRIGFLGAELARQIASIYGQASDYAAYYTSETAAEGMPKRQAMQTLMRYIDDVLPRLAQIEQTGHVTALARSAAPLPEAAAQTPARVVKPPRPEPEPAIKPIAREAVTRYDALTKNEPPAANSAAAVAPVSTTAEPSPAVDSGGAPAMTPPGAVTPRQSSAPPAAQIMPPSPSPSSSPLQVPLQLWEAVRNFAREHLPERTRAEDDSGEYTRLIEEEMSNYSFSDDDDELHEETLSSYAAKLKDTGS